MSSESIIIGNNNNFINIGNKSNISIINTNSTNTNSTNTNSTNTNSTLITSSVTGQSNVYNKTSFGIYVSFASLCKIGYDEQCAFGGPHNFSNTHYLPPNAYDEAHDPRLHRGYYPIYTSNVDQHYIRICCCINPYNKCDDDVKKRFDVVKSTGDTLTCNVSEYITDVDTLFGYNGTATFDLNIIDTTNPTPKSVVPPIINGVPQGPLNILKSGQELYSQNYLTSQNGQYYLFMQYDGHLCINKEGAVHATWCSDNYVKGQTDGQYKLVMQYDGNVCVNYISDNKPFWCTDSYGRGIGPWYLVMQNDGNLVEYDSNDNPVWSAF